MIASMIAKRKVHAMYLMFNENDVGVVDAFAANLHDDIVYDTGSDLGVGETIKGKKVVTDWLRRWVEEFPKRKFDVKNICFSSWPLSLNNVCTIQYTLTTTDKQGKTFKYDGVCIMHMKNFKLIHATEHMAFAGLPKVSTLIEPLAED